MSSSGSFVFGIRAFGSFIRIESFNFDIGTMLDRYVFPPLPREDPWSVIPDIDVHLEHASEGIRILINQKLVALGETDQDAILATVKALDDAVVQRLKDFRAVHAGAVLIEGCTVLFPGSTHAGKSSLVSEFLRRGASCFSDEYALIDAEGLVHPYPRPLLLRDGRPKQSLVLPGELNTNFAANSAPVDWIIATEYVPGGEWKIQQTSKSEAVTLLLCNTPHEMARDPQLVDFFMRASANARCCEGVRGDAAAAAHLLLDLINPK